MEGIKVALIGCSNRTSENTLYVRKHYIYVVTYGTSKDT